jgi:hypothetical protein
MTKCSPKRMLRVFAGDEISINAEIPFEVDRLNRAIVGEAVLQRFGDVFAKERVIDVLSLLIMRVNHHLVLPQFEEGGDIEISEVAFEGRMAARADAFSIDFDLASRLFDEQEAMLWPHFDFKVIAEIERAFVAFFEEFIENAHMMERLGEMDAIERIRNEVKGQIVIGVAHHRELFPQVEKGRFLRLRFRLFFRNVEEMRLARLQVESTADESVLVIKDIDIEETLGPAQGEIASRAEIHEKKEQSAIVTFSIGQMDVGVRSGLKGQTRLNRGKSGVVFEIRIGERNAFKIGGFCIK